MDTQLVHQLPDHAMIGDVEVLIVIPALNEELVIGKFVEWCKEGLACAGVRGQILIIDSSTDQTPSIALWHGAEVLRTPKGGLGRAYIDAMPFIRGQLCDLTARKSRRLAGETTALPNKPCVMR